VSDHGGIDEDRSDRPAESAVLSLSAWAPLRSRIFFALFIAQLVSNLGTLMQSVGAAWLIGDLGGTAAEVALVQTATFLPAFLVGIPAGALADVFDRRKVLLATQACMLVSAGLMAVLTFADLLTPTGVLALTFMLGTGAALMSPAWFAIQPDLVPREHFSQAVSLSSMTYTVGRAIGPAIGGLVIAAAGPGWVFALNALSFLGTIAVLAAWRPAIAGAGRAPAETLVGATVAGLRFSANSRLVRSVLMRVVLLFGAGAAIQSLLPIVVRGPLEWSSGGYGVLLGCFGIGATISAILRPQIVRFLHPDALLAAASFVMAGTLIVQGYVQNRLAVGIALLAGGFMWGLAAVTTTIAAQSALPSWVRARGMALYAFALAGSFAIGSALCGFAANWDLSRAHLIAAVVMALSPLAGFRWPLTWDREFDLTMMPGSDPEVVLKPAPDDGPVLVSVPYRVPLDDLDEFDELMRYIEGHRRRTGGYQWALFRDLSDSERFVEAFLVSSWAEHLRQHHRDTAHADDHLRRVRRFVAPPGVSHYLSTASEGAMELHNAQPRDDLDRAGGEDM
jgi:MFS family permease